MITLFHQSRKYCNQYNKILHLISNVALPHSLKLFHWLVPQRFLVLFQEVLIGMHNFYHWQLRNNFKFEETFIACALCIIISLIVHKKYHTNWRLSIPVWIIPKLLVWSKTKKRSTTVLQSFDARPSLLVNIMFLKLYTPMT